jgi:hypothetical protein
MGQIPTAPNSGTEGNQAVGTSIVPVAIAPPMQAASVPDAIDGLIATHSRNLGGDVAARLLAASMRQTSNQLAAAHETIAEQSSELRAANTAITDLRVENASLLARLNEMIGTNRIKQFTTFVATAVLGVAVDLYKDDLSIPALLLGLLGIGLLLFASLPTHGSTK